MFLHNTLDPLPTYADLKAHRRTTYLWIETGVVLLACVAPWLFNSLLDLKWPTWGSTEPFVRHALYYIFHDSGEIAVVLFIVWRSGDPLSRFGIRPFRFGKDVFGGIAFYAVIRGAYHVQRWAFHTFLSRHSYLALLHTGVGTDVANPSGAPEYVLLGVYCLLSGYAQELVMRAYLITRFEELLESTSLALLLSTVLFACYHGYQGDVGIVGAAIFGLIQGVLFCLFRRLGPLAVAHGLNNFIAGGSVLW
jgi:membrane protease YdiL (CAAX protease family)